MNARFLRVAILGWAAILASVSAAQNLEPINLPAPETTGGMPLMQALSERQSSREFSSETLTLEQLSNLLWAACGINRADSGKRTAPSAVNWQEIDVYVALPEGIYLYEPKGHTLQPVAAGDHREKTGVQPFVKNAAANLVYVADYARMGRGTEESKAAYSAADTGFISQNVYLYCASEGLATVVRGSVDKAALGEVLQLRPEQKIILAQSVGHRPR